MKINKLRKEAVRSTRQVENAVSLSPEKLRKVVSGGNQVLGEVDPETCAIHFYYPSDSVS
ncbi:MAG: hypothetical protein AAF657_39510 [Acidobacteriota bacterium]